MAGFSLAENGDQVSQFPVHTGKRIKYFPYITSTAGGRNSRMHIEHAYNKDFY